MYTEILKLKKLLEEANIPFEFKSNIFETGEEAYQIIISKDCIWLCDAVQHKWSYGHEKDLIEIMGALTEEEYKEDSVLGNLTADEVFMRFKYCYEKGTDIYLGILN